MARLAGVLLAGAVLLCSGIPQTRAQDGDQPRGRELDPYERNQAKYDGVSTGDSLINDRLPLRYERGGDGRMWIYTGDKDNGGWTHAETVAPQEEKDSADLDELATHANDPNLDGLRRKVIAHDEAADKDATASGQAEVVVNNTAADTSVTRDDIRNGDIAKQSAPILRDAGHNKILGEAFADCKDTTYLQVKDVLVHPTWTESCATVQLKFPPGYQGTLVRTVGREDNVTTGSTTLPLSVAAGETATLEGVLDAAFPETTLVLDSFTPHVLPEPVALHFTVTVSEQPMSFNQWHYSIQVARASDYATPIPLSLQVDYAYKGAPTYTFGSHCNDGNCGVTGDEFCRAKWTCDAVAPTVVDGVVITPERLISEAGPLYPVDPIDDPDGTRAAQSLICMKAHLDIDCSGIYTLEGEPDNGPPDTCQAYANNGFCNRMNSSCASGGFSETSNWCYVKTSTYLCRSDELVKRYESRTWSDCGSSAMATCLSGECQSPNRQPPENEVRKSVAKQVIYQHYSSDWLTREQEKAENEGGNEGDNGEN